MARMSYGQWALHQPPFLHAELFQRALSRGPRPVANITGEMQSKSQFNVINRSSRKKEATKTQVSCDVLFKVC